MPSGSTHVVACPIRLPLSFLSNTSLLWAYHILEMDPSLVHLWICVYSTLDSHSFKWGKKNNQSLVLVGGDFMVF